MKKLLVVIGSAKTNKGSEMLLRGIVKICKKIPDLEIQVANGDTNKCETLGIEGIKTIVPLYNCLAEYRTFIKIQNACIKLFRCSSYMAYLKLNHAILKEKYNEIIFVGADNFDYRGRYDNSWRALLQVLMEKNEAPIIVYDCSLQKENCTKQLLDTIKKAAAVTVRDTNTYKTLREIDENIPLYYYSDPAFTVSPQGKTERECTVCTEQLRNSVGVNLSNLILDSFYTKNADVILDAYVNMMEYFIKEQGLSIVLIPHVMAHADVSALKMLYEKCRYKDKVLLLTDEKMDGCEIKYIISQCRFFVGARTHATIAAYSSKVPTVVIGYSSKSIGIAQDLFGTAEQFVVPVTSISNADALISTAKFLIESEEEIRVILEQKMDSYIKNSYQFKDLVVSILNDSIRKKDA